MAQSPFTSVCRWSVEQHAVQQAVHRIFHKSKVYSKTTTSCTTKSKACNKWTTSSHVKMLYSFLCDLFSNKSTTNGSSGAWTQRNGVVREGSKQQRSPRGASRKLRYRRPLRRRRRLMVHKVTRCYTLTLTAVTVTRSLYTASPAQLSLVFSLPAYRLAQHSVR